MLFFCLFSCLYGQVRPAELGGAAGRCGPSGRRARSPTRGLKRVVMSTARGSCRDAAAAAAAAAPLPQEVLGQCGHYSERVRRDALQGLAELLAAHPGGCMRRPFAPARQAGIGPAWQNLGLVLGRLPPLWLPQTAGLAGAACGSSSRTVCLSSVCRGRAVLDAPAVVAHGSALLFQ